MNRHLRSTGFILLILSLLLAWGPSPALAAAGDLTLTTPKPTVDGNERFLISVRADAPGGLYGVQLSLTYDDTKLNVLERQSWQRLAGGQYLRGPSRSV